MRKAKADLTRLRSPPGTIADGERAVKRMVTNRIIDLTLFVIPGREL